jgi:hypothetical protein
MALETFQDLGTYCVSLDVLPLLLIAMPSWVQLKTAGTPISLDPFRAIPERLDNLNS